MSKHVKWRKTPNKQEWLSVDRQFRINLGAGLNKFMLWYGKQFGILDSRYPKLQQAKDRAQVMRDCGQA